MNERRQTFTLTRRDLLEKTAEISAAFFLAACGDSGGDQHSIRAGEGLETSVPYFPDSVLVHEETILKKLPKKDAETVNSHPKFYLANPLAFDPTRNAFLPKEDKRRSRDNLWLGFEYQGTKLWVSWADVRDQFIVLEGGKEVDKSPDILFGEPGEKSNEIKLNGGKIIKTLVFPQK